MRYQIETISVQIPDSVVEYRYSDKGVAEGFGYSLDFIVEKMNWLFTEFLKSSSENVVNFFLQQVAEGKFSNTELLLMASFFVNDVQKKFLCTAQKIARKEQGGSK